METKKDGGKKQQKKEVVDETPKFYKFPKTLHLEGSDIVDEDQSIGFAQFKNFQGKLIIQVKIT